MSKYAFLRSQAETWAVNDLCRVLQVSRSGYYQWRAAKPQPAPDWPLAAQQAFTRPARRYGTRRLRAEVQAEGHRVGRCALRRWLRASGQQALSPRPQRPRTTQADPVAVVAENRLLGQPAPTRPNQVWVGAITYLPLVGGRGCYLATWRDACSRRVVGFGAAPAALSTWPRRCPLRWCSPPWSRP